MYKNIDTNKLCSGLFSDVMDTLGYRNQVISGMKCNLKMVSILGKARTIQLETVETSDENIRKGLSFLADVGSGEILLVKGSKNFAYFGELMTKLSTRQGIEGIVIGGLTRDTNYTHQDFVKLPILAQGYSPVDIKGRGRVSETDIAIEINGVIVQPYDLVYIDNEAVCIVPKEIEDQVIELVQTKLVEEQRISDLIDSGISVEELLKTVVEF